MDWGLIISMASLGAITAACAITLVFYLIGNGHTDEASSFDPPDDDKE